MDIGAIIAGIFGSQDIILRFALIILIALYGLFALIVAIQINNLNRTINQIGFSSILNMFAIIHLFAALALLILAVLSL